MLDALGFDSIIEDNNDFNLALVGIEAALGAYPAFVKNVDAAPRPAQYRAVLIPLGDRAINLAEDVGNLNGYLSDALAHELKAGGDDIYAIEEALSRLRAAAYRVVDRFGTAESRGGPKAESRRWVVNRLCDIYAKHSRVNRAERATFGSQSNLSEWEAARLEFVQTALHDAEIPFPRDLLAVIRSIAATS